jgi:GNAT superfamily N-acetyltransferase
VEQDTLSAPARSPVVSRHDSPSESISGQIQRIYTEAFPPGQRTDYGALIAAVAEGSRLLFTAQEDGQFLAFAITTPLPGTDIHCLEYFAVRQGERGRGIGARLLGAVLSDLHATEHASGLILEVEPEQEGSEPERETRRARVAFYRRNGAYSVQDVEHFLAPDLLIDGAVIEMKLMWLPADGAPASLSSAELYACICGIYSQCYGLPLDDPRVEATLRSYGRTVRSRSL